MAFSLPVCTSRRPVAALQACRGHTPPTRDPAPRPRYRGTMMAGSHVVVGAAAWYWLAPHLGLPPLSPISLGLAVGGALLPDIDHPQSWMGRRIRLISRPLSAVVGHRGVTHSFLAIAAGILVLRSHGPSREFALPLVVGYLSHLAADLLTPAGLRLAWPLSHRTAIPLCRTGSIIEPVFVAGLLIWTGAAILRLHPPRYF
jgi:inner membrane protein